MIPILLINMKRNPERLNLMEGNFKKVGLNFTRIDAVDGKLLSDKELNEFAAKRPGIKSVGKWTKGKMGCNLSHNKAWEIAANSSAPYTAIFEDDIWMAPSVKEFLSDHAWIPEDADIVRLESTAFMRCLLSNKKYKTYDNRYLQKLLPNKSKNAFALGAGAYIVKKEAARRMINAPLEWLVYTDRSLFDYKSSKLAQTLKTYQVNPACCVQDKFYHKDPQAIQYPSEIETEEHKSIYANNNKLKTKLIKYGEPLGLYEAFRIGRKILLILAGYKRVLYKK